MCPPPHKSKLLRTSVFGQKHRVLDGHAAIQHTVHEKKSTTLLIEDSICDEGVFGLAF